MDDKLWINIKNMFETHTLEVFNVQEIAVRKYIYNQIGKKGHFSLHFDDLKFSFPTSLVSGNGCFTFQDSIVHYEVMLDCTYLKADDPHKLVAIVLAALDDYL
jgi:hypothetical protein